MPPLFFDGMTCDTMFYFGSQTSEYKTIRAIFTGRFCFVLGIDEDVIRDCIRQNDPDCVADPVLREELLHSLVFRRCLSGLALNGLRYAVRLLWAMCGSRYVVEQYYRLRTAFYLIMYEVHEDIVARGKKRFELLKSDYSYYKFVVQRCNPFFSLSFILLSPILSVVGYVLTAHYSVVICGTCNGNSMNFVSKNKYVDSVTRDNNKLYGFFGKWLQLENWIKSHSKDYAAWTVFKFTAEEEALSEFLPLLPYGTASFYSDFRRYLMESVSIAGTWCNSNNVESWIRIVTILLGAERPAEKISKIEAEQDLYNICNFYYLHGN